MDTAPTIISLRPGMRPLLLELLRIAYPAAAPQARLSNAPDGAVAWMTQSMLDDHADYDALKTFQEAA